MYRRINITLSDDLLARADDFAQRERYTRSGLISAALDAFMARDPRIFEVEGRPGSYSPVSVGLNPAVRPFIAALIDECRASGVVYAGLVGASTRPDAAVVPRELELLVRFAPGRGLVQYAHALTTRLELLTRMPVRVRYIDDLSEEQLEVAEATLVVLYDAEVDSDAEGTPDD